MEQTKLRPRERRALARGNYDPIGPKLTGDGPPELWYGWPVQWHRGDGPHHVAMIAGNWYKARIGWRRALGYYWHIEPLSL